MSAQIIETILVLPLVVASAVSFLIYIYSFFYMLAYARGGRWSRFVFHPEWWNPDKIDQFIEPNGLPHYRRLKKASFWFMITALCWLVLGALAEFR